MDVCGVNNSFVDLKPLGSQQREMSQTDWKVHAVVILKSLLLAVGIALACASFYFATIVHPMIAAATPSVPFTLWAVLQMQPPSLAVPIEKTIPGFRNGGANCWLNSALELLVNVPAYRKIFEKLLHPQTEDEWRARFELQPFVKTYENYHEEKKEASPKALETQPLREWVSKVFPVISSNIMEQEYPSYFLEYFFKNLDFERAKIEKVVTRDDSDNPNNKEVSYEDCNFLQVHLHEEKENVTAKDMKEILEDSFTSISEVENERYTTVTTKSHFVSTPEDLTIEVLRTDNKGKNTHLQLSHALEIDVSQEHFRQEARYRCDGFISRAGSSDQAGHYYAFVLIDGQWWKANDSRVQIASLEEVERELASSSTILHYQKV